MNPAIKKHGYEKKLRKYLPIVLLLTMIGLGGYINSSIAGSSNEMPVKKAVKISPDIQFMPPLGVTLPNGIERLAIWPSQEDINKHYAKTDISEKFPPVFSKREELKGRPIKEGAVSPQKAIKQSARWIRQVFKPEWVPEGIENFMIPLRDERPERSTVICRYKIDNTSVQISQTRWAMSIILNVPDEEKLVNAEEFATVTFKKYFNEGDKMGALKGKMVPKESMHGPGEINISLLDMRKLHDPEPVQSWWGWLAWANKDSTLVVFLPKRIYGEQHTTTPDEPWF